MSTHLARRRSAQSSSTSFRASRARRWLCRRIGGPPIRCSIDIDFAKKAGFPDVFAQGMLVMAMLGQA